MTIFIILLTTFVATFLSSMSGGGASVINLPVFLSLGISFPLATAMQKISSTFWLLPASRNYLKGRKVDWMFLILFSIVGLIGAYLGIQFIIDMNQEVLKRIVGIFILFLVIYTYFQKGLGLKEEKVYSRIRQLMAYPFALLLGFYESLFGSGNGIAFAIVSFYTRGFDFIDALGYYFSIGFLWVFFGAIMLFSKGYYDVQLMIPAVIGGVLGGYIGSKYAKYKGNRFIKIVFVIVGSILGLKLVLGL